MQPVNVYYDLGGGINDSKNYAKELANPSTPLTLYAPTRDGYTFDGWYLDYGNGCKKVPEINGVYQVSWEDIHHMGESPTLNASSYYKKYYKNSNTLFVYARWKEIEYHYVDLTLIGNGKSVINEKISVCSEDFVRYVFTPDKGWCLSSVNVNGEEVDSKRLLQIAKYGLLLKDVDEDLSITATFSEGVYLSLAFGENVKTAYVIGSLNGVTKKFYDGDYIPAEYFKKWSVPIKKSRKNSSTERAQLIKDENLDVEESLGEYAFLKALLTPFSTQFTLVVELNEPREGYLYVLDDASSFTPVESDVFQKNITIKSTDAFKEIDVGSAVEKPVEKVEVTYGVGSYVLDHYISTDKNATSGTQNSITLDAGQIAYLFIKPYADTFYYNYEIDEDFTEISDGWYVKAYYVTADEANLGRIVVYRSHQYYTVTWLNWDGSEIYSEEYQVGEIPVFYDDRFDNPNAPTRPDDGIYSYVFTGWDKTVKTVTENVSYTATYETVLRRFTVTVEPTENGSIILPDENGYITYEDVKTYTFTPNDGYRIKDVFVNGKSIGGVDSYTFSGVTCDQTLKVEFEKIKYTVTVVCNGNGTVDCPETSLVEHGSSLTINITPSSSYVIDYIKVNGENAEISQSFTLNNLTCDAVVEIGFVKVIYEGSPSDSETSTPSSESSTPSCTGSLGKNATADYFVIALCGISLAVITLIKKGKAF